MSSPPPDPGSTPTTGTPPAGSAVPPPTVPDHELLRRIGRGAYGEVWLARSVTGAFRAVKIVHRASFDHDRPFEREFEGILKFEPVSRRHDSQVDILHVGRAGDCFYYVMELADDQATGGQIPDPALYKPRTLKSDLLFRNRLPFEDCVQIGIALTTALEHLHAHGLVHRDVKPSNIIFVNGVAKLADIGLVTGVDATRSYVGTEGFAAPEGPGTPQADLFSLGKVLYEAATGKDRQEFPELPTQLRELPDREGLMELNAVIARACRHDPKDRYLSAAAMRADLELLQSGKSLARVHRLETRLRAVRRAIAGVTLLAATVALGWWWQAKQTLTARKLTIEIAGLAEEQTAARDHAQQSERDLRLLLDFFEQRVIAVARPKSVSGGLGSDITVLQALENAEAHIVTAFGERPLLAAELRLELGRTYTYLGQHDRAVDQFIKALELRTNELGKGDPLTMAAGIMLAEAYKPVGNPREAVNAWREVFVDAVTSLGPTNVTTLGCLASLGVARRELGETEAAIEDLERAYRDCSLVLGSDADLTMATLNHLAVTYQIAGQTTRAIALLEELKSAVTRTHGTDDEPTTRVMIDLARALQQAGRHDQALPLLESALQIRRRVHGDASGLTLIAMNALAHGLREMHRFDEAESLFREARTTLTADLGSNHPETRAAQEHLAFLISERCWVFHRNTNQHDSVSVEEALKRVTEAEQLVRDCLAMLPDAPDRLDPGFAALHDLLAACKITSVALRAADDRAAKMNLAEAEALLLRARQEIGSSNGNLEFQLNRNAIYLSRLYETWHRLAPGEGKGELLNHWRSQQFQPRATAPAP